MMEKKTEIMCLACDSVFMGDVDDHCPYCGAGDNDLINVTDSPEGHFEGDMGSLGNNSSEHE